MPIREGVPICCRPRCPKPLKIHPARLGLDLHPRLAVSPVLLGTTDSGMQASGIQGLFGAAATEQGAAVSAGFVDLLSFLLLPPAEEVPEDVPAAFVFPEAVPERENDPAGALPLGPEILLPVVPTPTPRLPPAPALAATPEQPTREIAPIEKAPGKEIEASPVVALPQPVVLRQSKPAAKLGVSERPAPKEPRKAFSEVTPAQLAAAVIRSMMVPAVTASPAPVEEPVQQAEEPVAAELRQPVPVLMSAAPAALPVPVTVAAFVPPAAVAAPPDTVHTATPVEVRQNGSSSGEPLPRRRVPDAPLAFGLRMKPLTADIESDAPVETFALPQTESLDVEASGEAAERETPSPSFRPEVVAMPARGERAVSLPVSRPNKTIGEFPRRIPAPAVITAPAEALPQTEQPAAFVLADVPEVPGIAPASEPSPKLAEPAVLPKAARTETSHAAAEKTPVKPAAPASQEPNPAPAHRPPKESAPDASKPRPLGPEGGAGERIVAPLSAPAPAIPVHRAEAPALAAEPTFHAPMPAPHASVGHALRESAVLTVAEAAPPSNLAVREIAVRVASPGQSPVDLQMTERAGQVRVDVRTSDGALQTALRQDLGSLVQSLERSGYRAEAFVPADTHRSSLEHQRLYTQQAESGAGTFDQRGERRQNPREPQPRPRRKQERTVNAMETAA